MSKPSRKLPVQGNVTATLISATEFFGQLEVGKYVVINHDTGLIDVWTGGQIAMFDRIVAPTTSVQTATGERATPISRSSVEWNGEKVPSQTVRILDAMQRAGSANLKVSALKPHLAKSDYDQASARITEARRRGFVETDDYHNNSLTIAGVDIVERCGADAIAALKYNQ